MTPAAAHGSPRYNRKGDDVVAGNPAVYPKKPVQIKKDELICFATW